MALIIRTTGWEDYIDRSGGAYIKVLIMGLPDVGKTRSSSYYPAPIIADCEKGRMSIADRAVPYAEVRSSLDMDALLAHLRVECQRPPESRKYRTLVIDTIDSYQRTLVAERLRSERKEALSGWADWGFLDAKMTQLLEKMLNLPMNIVVNLHTKDEADGDEASKMMIKRPKLKGDIKDQIAAEFDLIGQMEKSYVAENGERTTKRQIRWHSEPRYPMLKDRSGRLPRFTDIDFTPADFQRIYDCIVAPHVDDMPAGEVLETLDNGEVDPAPPDVRGGPVVVDELLALPPAVAKPARKTAAKKTAKAGASPVPAVVEVKLPEGDVEVDTATGEITAAVALVQNRLGGEVIADGDGAAHDAGTTEPSTPVESSPLCGDQPAHFQKKFPAAPGCRKSLAEESRDRVNIALLRTKTFLCEACLCAWKAAN